MSLYPCPACHRQVSSQATLCPGCGHPLHSNAPLADVAANLKRGIEYMGGRLSILSDRLVFRSHAFNLQTGITEIPLREIAEVRPGKMLFVIPNRIDVVLRSGVTYVFVVRGRERLMQVIDDQRRRLS